MNRAILGVSLQDRIRNEVIHKNQSDQHSPKQTEVTIGR